MADFAPFDYNQAVGGGMENAFRALQLSSGIQDMQAKQREEQRKSHLGVLAAAAAGGDQNARAALTQAGGEGIDILDKISKLNADQLDQVYKAANVLGATAQISDPQSWDINFTKLSERLPEAKVYIGHPELRDQIMRRAFILKNGVQETFGKFQQLPGAPEGTVGQIGSETGLAKNIQTPAKQQYTNITMDAQGKPWGMNTATGQFEPVPAKGFTKNAEVGPEEAQAYVNNILQGNMTMRQVPAVARPAVVMALNSQPKTAYSPTAVGTFSTAAARIEQNFLKLPQYQLTANGLPYLQRIKAAMETPGSVSDQDLLDSLTKLNTAGNAITDAQVKLVTGGRSWADSIDVLMNKTANGGVLSDNQRKQVQKIATAIYDNYKKGYQPVYDQVASQLRASGIPPAFWSIPDLNKLSTAYDQTGGAAPASTQQPQSTLPSIDDLVNKYAK